MHQAFQLFVLVKVFSFHLSRGWIGANLPRGCSLLPSTPLPSPSGSRFKRARRLEFNQMGINFIRPRNKSHGFVLSSVPISPSLPPSLRVTCNRYIGREEEKDENTYLPTYLPTYLSTYLHVYLQRSPSSLALKREQLLFLFRSIVK